MNKAFTLSEVLISIGIIGVISALTIPMLITKYRNIQYKIAYKKAYADLLQAVKLAVDSDELVYRAGNSEYNTAVTESEWELIFKKNLKAVVICGKNTTNPQINKCWADGELLYKERPTYLEKSMVDLSGRSWSEYYYMLNLYLVDTNGLSKPNQYGKDRWIFQLVPGGRDGSLSVVIFSGDKLTKDENVCNYPPCYFKSWLK